MSEPEENPYATPLYEPQPLSQTTTYMPKRALFAAALCSLAGTSLAGGLFGIIGCLFGVIFGFLIAAIVGTPVTGLVFTLFALSSPSQIPRSRVICVAAGSGAITGFVSCSMLFSGLPGVSKVELGLACVAAAMGAAGAALFVFLFCRVAVLPEPPAPPPAVWHDLE